MSTRRTLQIRDSNLTKRLYGKYNWETASRVFLAANPVCFWCLENSQVTDHITPYKGDDTLFLNPANWQPLCVPCHNWKTRLEQMGMVADWPLRAPGIAVVCGEALTGKTTRIKRQSEYAPFMAFLNGPLGVFQTVLVLKEIRSAQIQAGFEWARGLQSRLIVCRCSGFEALRRRTAAWAAHQSSLMDPNGPLD